MMLLLKEDGHEGGDENGYRRYENGSRPRHCDTGYSGRPVLSFDPIAHLSPVHLCALVAQPWQMGIMVIGGFGAFLSETLPEKNVGSLQGLCGTVRSLLLPKPPCLLATSLSSVALVVGVWSLRRFWWVSSARQSVGQSARELRVAWRRVLEVLTSSSCWNFLGWAVPWSHPWSWARLVARL